MRIAQPHRSTVDTPAKRCPMNRDASVRLRHLVDAAVGAHYDQVFLRLDLLATTREGRCGCVRCAATLAARRADLLADLPALPALPAA